MRVDTPPNSIETPADDQQSATDITHRPSSIVHRPPSVQHLTGRLLLPGIFLLGLALRVLTLDARSLWYDEVQSIEAAQRGVNAILTDRFGWMLNQTPLHYLLVWLTVQPVDPTATSALARLPSALAGSLTVLVLYALGKELFGRAQGLLAALLFALSAVALTYSQDLRPYALMTLLTTLSVYCLVKAEQTGAGRWWAAFAAFSIANLAIAYVALSLVLPALAPFLALIVWKARSRKEVGKVLLGLGLSCLAIAAAAAFDVVDILRVSRVAPDLRQLDPASILLSPIELVGWFTQFGTGGQLERLVQLAPCMVSVWGLYLAVKAGHWRGAVLCASLILVPATILLVLGTTNPVFQRYALFAMPFYFLLIANGLAPALDRRWTMDDRRWGSAERQPDPNRPSSTVHRPPSALSTPGFKLAIAGLALLVLGLFIFAGFVYFDPVGHSRLAYRPDYRAVSAYLAQHVTADDVVVFAEGDPMVSTFYWRGVPPAPAYSVIDPRLPAQRVRGSVYWIAANDALPPSEVAPLGWVEEGRFEGLVLAREKGPVNDVAGSIQQLADAFSRRGTATHAVELRRAAELMRGCVYQARGDVAGAIKAYRASGTQFRLGEEHLRGAEAYSTRGDNPKAWREAIVSKGQEPQTPQVHFWFARQLLAEGYPAQSLVETQIAQDLAGATPGGRPTPASTR